MSFHRFVLFISCLLLSLGWAATVHAKAYSLTGGGAQFQVGGGLPLPIQLTNPSATGTVFPTLLIPAKAGQVIHPDDVENAVNSQSFPTKHPESRLICKCKGLFNTRIEFMISCDRKFSVSGLNLLKQFRQTF